MKEPFQLLLLLLLLLFDVVVGSSQTTRVSSFENNVNNCLLETDELESIESEDFQLLIDDDVPVVGGVDDEGLFFSLSANAPHVIKVKSDSNTFGRFLIRAPTTEFSSLFPYYNKDNNNSDEIQSIEECTRLGYSSLASTHNNNNNNIEYNDKEEISGILFVNIDNDEEEGTLEQEFSLDVALETSNNKWLHSHYKFRVMQHVVGGGDDKTNEHQEPRDLQRIRVIPPPEIREVFRQADQHASNVTFWYEQFGNGNVDNGIPAGKVGYGFPLSQFSLFNTLFRLVWSGKSFFEDGSGVWNVFSFRVESAPGLLSIEPSVYDGGDVMVVNYTTWDPIGPIEPCVYCRDEMREIPDFAEGVWLGRGFDENFDQDDAVWFLIAFTD